MIASRAGLSMDPGAKVTYNGVQIGRVGQVDEINPKRSAAGEDHPRRGSEVPQVDPGERASQDHATTVFGNKYVAFSSPKTPVPNASPAPT